ncbi:methyltransferase [Sphingomonas sp.]|jgi:predicted methyltransferase|uniref:class I SAM-dependent methyltransferase n=1 Tax=Sphingomonas sp. TaxID=28214 RepID=UPI002D80648B|nr:methyltransferase [Sphingomonas sp.]HEU0044095.1 methyltransferase [Sphingomonas sp.]
MNAVYALAPLALLIAMPGAAQTPSTAVQRALADPSRPAADRARDEGRHAARLLTFAGVKPGMKVADFIMGGGYWTRLLAGVVGPKGKVYAYQPAEFIAFRAAYGTEQDAAVAGRANIVAKRESVRAIAFPEKLDAIMTVQNWHDLHLNFAPEGTAAAAAKRLYDALKPGGVLLVIDHAAVAGAPRTVADTLHRIDPARARTEIEAAGFQFDGESALLRQPGDPRTQLVFDPAIRGKTDQFVYRFRKPR